MSKIIELVGKPKRYFVAYFHFNGLNINLGISINLVHPNMEIHIPFGFFRIGWEKGYFVEGKPMGDRGWGYRYGSIIGGGSGRKAKIREIVITDAE